MTNQIRIMELRGTYKGGGGPDKTILLSAQKHNPKRFFVLVTYLRDPKDDDFQIGNMAQKLKISDYIEVYDNGIFDLKCLLQLNQLLRINKIQLIHVHDLKTTLLGVILKILNPNVKIMNTAHGWIINSRLDELKQKLQFILLRFYPFHIAVSEATRGILMKNGISSAKIQVLFNSIDTEYWQKNNENSTIREEFGIEEETFIIGTVGRICKEKDLPTFFQVAKAVLKVYRNTFFIIVGDGKHDIEVSVKNLILSTELKNRIIFTGRRTDLKNIYSSFDIFLSTSLTEGLPNTILEAMAMEVPVVATRVGGVPELVIENKTGLMCKPGASDELNEKIITFLTNKNKRQQFSKNARQYIVKYFSFKERLVKIEQIYTELVY